MFLILNMLKGIATWATFELVKKPKKSFACMFCGLFTIISVGGHNVFIPTIPWIY